MSEERQNVRKLLVNSKSWVSPRYFEKGRDLSGESLVLLYFLFVSIYTYMLYFQFSLGEKKAALGVMQAPSVMISPTHRDTLVKSRS